jgi:CBS domain-containing protein
MTTVGNLMTSDPVTLHEEDDLARAIEIFSTEPIRHLPVTDGEGNTLVGVVSQRDALRWSGSAIDPSRFTAKQASDKAHERFVAEVMIRDVVTATPDTPVSEAARLLLQGGFGCLPVVDDDNKLLGIVTETDLLRQLIGDELVQEQPPHAPPPSRPLSGD